MRRPAVAAAIVVLGALVIPPGAQACSCARIAPAKAMRQADAAIVARLVKVIPRNRFRADYRYRVRRVYRGAQMIDRGETISVRSARDSAACGLPDRQDRAVGLFLHRDDRRWTAGLCSVIDPDQLWAAARHAYAGGPRQAVPDCAS